MQPSSVLIVDYGVGNIFNVKRALESLGAIVTVSSQTSDILTAKRIVLPGVGAFAAGMAGLKSQDLIEPLKEAALVRETPLFGVCLGMQLLMDSSEENGYWQGLGLIPGTVKRLTPKAEQIDERKIPHIGWNSAELPSIQISRPWQNTIFSQVKPGESFYFVHSYHVVLERAEDMLAETSYGGMRFCSALSAQNIAGCQFHPERSGEAGLGILRNFLYENT